MQERAALPLMRIGEPVGPDVTRAVPSLCSEVCEISLGVNPEQSGRMPGLRLAEGEHYPYQY